MPLRFPATNDAPLPLAARRDVFATAVAVPGRDMWVVKDPLSLEQHELGEREFFLLALLDEQTSLRELQHALERRFAPERIAPAEIQNYLSRLHQAGLLMSTASGQGAALADEARRRRYHRYAWSWTEVLAIRFRGIDPDRLLDRLHTVLRPLFRPVAQAVAAAIILAAIWLIVAHAGEFVDRLPTLAELFAPRNWLWLAATVAVVKVLHELGHALVAKHFGGEVHELGVMLLAFVPTLYCDVTDIWSLPNRWQRMAVSAAGMAMELLIAAVATFVWWFSEPGIVNLLALNTMVVASVGTLLVNANPLMRYDGYYLLCDLTETTNLWQRSRDAWHRWASALVMRTKPNEPHEPLWIGIYGALSSAYLLLVLTTIAWAAAVALKPLGLGVLAYGLGLVMFGSVIAGPARKLRSTLSNPVRRRDFRPISALALLGVLALVGALVWRMPIADQVTCQATVVPAGAREVVTTIGGQLETCIAPGAVVNEGDVVAQLTNPDIDLAAIELAGELEVANLQVAQLEALRARDPKANNELPTARTRRDEAERRLKELQSEAKRLTIRAPRGGRVFPPRDRPTTDESITLATWSGSPLEAHNQGAWLDSGTTVAVIASHEAADVLLAIDESDIELIEPGQTVRVQLDAFGSQPLVGAIVDVAQIGTGEDQPQASPTRWPGATPEVTARYEARVVLNNCPNDLPIDSGGRVKVEVGSITVGGWIVRELRDTLRLPYSP